MLTNPKANILLVDDNPANLLALRAILDDLGHNLIEAHSGEEALQKLLSQEFAVVLLDVFMPDFDGFETAKVIRQHNRFKNTPIIFLTANDIERAKLEQGYLLGAVDFLVKPLVPIILKAKVRGFVDLFIEKQRGKREAQQLRLLIEGTSDYAIFMLDTEGRVVTWNPGAERIKGYRATEIVGQQFSRFYPKEALDREWPKHELNVARTQGRFEDEGWRVRKDGTMFWANVVITALQDESGKLQGFSKITRDLTSRKEAEENARRLLQEESYRLAAEAHAQSIQEQQERLHVTLASIGDAVISTDTEGRVTFLNPVAEHLTAWSREEAKGKPLFEVFKIVNEETRKPVENPALKALKEGVVVGLANHTILIAKDGLERPIDDSAAPMRDLSGRIIGTVLVFRDITERKKSENALRASEERKSAILENALDCIITIDHQGIVLEFNPAAEKTFGFSREQAIGKELAQLIIPLSLRERHRQGMAHLLATGEGPVLNRRIELSALRADGKEFPVELAITRISTNGPPFFTAYLRDITEKTRQESYRRARLAVNQVLNQAGTAEDAALGILEAIGDNLGWVVGLFWTLNPQMECLQYLVSWHNPDSSITELEANSRKRTFHRGQGLPGRVWEAGNPSWILDVLHDDNFPRYAFAIKDGLHGGFACPILLGGETLGVMEFFSKEIREPDADLMEFLETVTGQIAQFIERKESEKQLRSSEQELADFFDNATIGLHWVGPDGIIQRVNKAELNLLGYSSQEYVGQHIAKFHADQDVIGDILRRLQAGETLHDYAAQMLCKDGSLCDVLIDSSVMWKDKEFIHTRCFTRDVTEQKRADEQIRFQAHLLDTVGQAAIVTEPDGTIIYWNRFAEGLYGWAKSEVLGRNIIEAVVAPDSLEQAQEIMDRLRAGKDWSGEFPVRRRDGTRFHAHVTDTPIFDEQGKLKAIIGVSIDITDRKRTEQGLRFLADASATLAVVVDYQSTLQKVAGLAVPHFADWCAVDMLETDGSLRRLAVVHADPAKVALAEDLQRRYPPDPTALQGAYQVVRTGESEMMTDIPDALLIQGARDEEHLRILRDLGIRSYMCVPLKGRRGIIGVVSFVSAESELRYTKVDLSFAEELARRAAIAIENTQLYSELREADRRKDEFLATLAHELRNPLAPIRNALQVLKMPRVDEAIARQSREMMERQVHHLVRLVDDLLDVSRVMRGKIELRKESVELATIVARAVETAQPLIEAQGHQLTITLPHESMLMNADPVRLTQVVGNLLTNAAKYTEANGRIQVIAEREGNEAVLRVQDTGIGIASDMLPHIFELFVQVDYAAVRSQGGLGIGLTLVKSLVEIHHGTIKARSEGLGKGSEFILRLPLLTLKQVDASHKDNIGQAPATPSSGHRLLVVDDNQDAANSLSMLLRLQGHEVQVAFSGQAALEVTKRYFPDAVFLDLGMPGMDGYEVARRMRQQPGLEKVVLAALTGWGQKEDRRRTTEAGFNYHLIKPPDPKALEGVLATLNLPVQR